MEVSTGAPRGREEAAARTEPHWAAVNSVSAVTDAIY